MESLRT